MIVVDASVLIAHLDDSDVHHEAATGLLLDAAEETLGASPITLAEVFVGPAKKGRLSAARTALDALAVQEISLGPDAASRLALLRAETGLKLPDCCVLLAAQDGHATSIKTFDDRLRAKARALGLAAG